MTHPGLRVLPPIRRYAEQLAGTKLPRGWQVTSIVPRAAGQTGGRFSVSYLVENEDGRRGFLKAIDLSSAFGASNITSALKPLIDAYEFERDLLEECKGRRMDRVVMPLDHGDHVVDPIQLFSRVPYIIFERGEGDIRGHLNTLAEIDVAWALRALHNIALGLRQLHIADVSHQDLKPSNVMVFAEKAPVPIKLGDLGHAVRKGAPPPRPETAVIGGDPAHAPPEQLYDAAPTDWATHRVGADLYHLGSMAVFLFSRSSMTALLLDEVPPQHRPRVWRGSFPEVLPILRDAFDRGMVRFVAEVPASIRDDLDAAVRQLCDPDPSKRGHPRARAVRHGSPYSLEQYISLFNSLSARIERGLTVRTR